MGTRNEALGHEANHVAADMTSPGLIGPGLDNRGRVGPGEAPLAQPKCTDPAFAGWLEDYLERFKLSEDAQRFVREAFASLSRDVGTSGYRSVVTEYQSRKNGRTVWCESRRGEVALATKLEYGSRHKAYCEQLPEVTCLRTNRRGKLVPRPYRADFLTLRDDGPIVYEAKSESRIAKLLAKHPQDWKRRDGRVVDLPAEAAFKAMGLRHRVVSTADLSRLRTANLTLLIQARASPIDDIERIRPAAKCALEKHCVMTLGSLAIDAGTVDLTPILGLVADGTLCVDLSKHLLSDPNACLVSLEPDLLEYFGHNGSYGADLFSAVTSAPPVEIAEAPPAKQAKRALKILGLLKHRTARPRSRSRWEAQIRDGARRGKSAFESVVPRNWAGNTQPHREITVLAFAENFIRSKWAHKPCTEFAAGGHAEYCMDAEEWHPGHDPVTPPTFRGLQKYLRKILAFSTGGRRAANAVEEPTNEPDRVLKATRAFELATCDHCLCKIWVVVRHANGFVYVARPWLTVLRDCATGAVLAIWVSLKPPSRHAIAMVLRSCLRRHGRLPEGIVVDRGAEFRSTYFSALLADLGINRVLRPTSHPRYGSEAERYFGSFKTFWLAGRPGNCVLSKNARCVSGTHQPKKFAQLELLDFLKEALDFVDWHNAYTPGAEVKSPSVLVAELLAKFACSGHKHTYDQTFIIKTAVDVTNYTLDPQRGIHIGPAHYWAPELDRAKLEKKAMLVRIEPEDPSRVYVKIQGKWIVAYSGKAGVLGATDPVRRLAEAIFARDGAAIRELALADAHKGVVGMQRALDKAYAERDGQRSSPISDKTPEQKPVARSFFDVVREDELVPSPITSRNKDHA